MTEARQTIAEKITFRLSNENSLDRQTGAHRSSRKKLPIYTV